MKPVDALLLLIVVVVSFAPTHPVASAQAPTIELRPDSTNLMLGKGSSSGYLVEVVDRAGYAEPVDFDVTAPPGIDVSVMPSFNVTVGDLVNLVVVVQANANAVEGNQSILLHAHGRLSGASASQSFQLDVVPTATPTGYAMDFSVLSDRAQAQSGNLTDDCTQNPRGENAMLPGESGLYPVRITNTGSQTETVRLFIRAPDAGYVLDGGNHIDIKLAPGDRKECNLRVFVGSAPLSEGTYTLEFVAAPVEDPSAYVMTYSSLSFESPYALGVGGGLLAFLHAAWIFLLAHPAAGFLGALGIGGVAVVFIRRRWPDFLPWLPLYSRVRHDEVLDSEVRRTLHAAIKKWPGMTLAELSSKSGKGRTEVAYHLRRLVDADLVEPRGGRQRRYFVRGEAPRDRRQDRITKAQRAFLGQVKDEPHTCQDLAREAGLASSTAYRYLIALEAAGLVVKHPGTGPYGHLWARVRETEGEALPRSDRKASA